MRHLFITVLLFAVVAAEAQNILVLGTAQDGGFPHIGCQDECQLAHKRPELAQYVVSLALVDPDTKKWWLFEATPDMDKQLQLFQELTERAYPYLPDGIFITHAHIGHYTGLMFLGREAFGTNGVKVYGLPRMKEFLQTNGPWSQLVELGNIQLQELSTEEALNLNDNIVVNTFTVPHRDEFSETAGFKIEVGRSAYLFIPDIDKWEKWDQNIVELINTVNYAFLDATFFADGELPNRAMSEVPHPFVMETVELFKKKSWEVKRKICFIHLNHTNPLLFDRKIRSNILKQGYQIAEQGKTY